MIPPKGDGPVGSILANPSRRKPVFSPHRRFPAMRNGSSASARKGSSMLERHTHPAHVVMAKNLADSRDSGGLSRGQVLAAIAREEGFPTWEAFRAAGRRRLLIETREGQAEIPTGLLRIGMEAPDAEDTFILSLRKRGMWGDAIGPIVFGSASSPGCMSARYSSLIGLVCDGTFGPGREVIVRDAAEVLDKLRGLSPAYEGVIHLPCWLAHRPCTLVEQILEGWPRAILSVLSTPFDADRELRASVLTGTSTLTLVRPAPLTKPLEVIRHPCGPDVNGMWFDRMVALVLALRSTGQPVGPMVGSLTVEQLRALPRTPQMAGFLHSLPGYTDTGEISPVTREQLFFLTMQMVFPRRP